MLKRASYVVLGAVCLYGSCKYFEVPKSAYRKKEKNEFFMDEERLDSLNKEGNFLERILEKFE